MAKNQLVLTEYGPGEQPLKYHFPERNRIISGLCQGVMVVEAKLRSGSLITCERAMEEGRDIFAIPGNLFFRWKVRWMPSPNSGGCKVHYDRV